MYKPLRKSVDVDGLILTERTQLFLPRVERVASSNLQFLESNLKTKGYMNNTNDKYILSQKQYRFLIDMTVKYKEKDLKRRLRKRLIGPKEASILTKQFLNRTSQATPIEEYESKTIIKHSIVKPAKMTLKIKTIRDGKETSSYKTIPQMLR